MSGRLILWDIDGTLVRAGEIGAGVFDLALEKVLGVRPPSRVVMSGRTDPQIAREYLELMGHDPEEHLVGVLAHLEHELAAAAQQLTATGSVCPGVEEVLADLGKDSRIAQSVLTGNIAPNAVVKLAAFGLDRYLDLGAGAYGSDEADRRLLVPVALARQASLRGRHFSAEETWIVGDSPLDLDCARAGGANCALVATGRFTFAELEPLGADAVLEDLSDTESVLALLAGDLWDWPRR
jgi:phosphoglycolate phosphatase